jgi:hypothetical protein
MLPQHGRVVLVVLQDGRQLEGELHTLTGGIRSAVSCSSRGRSRRSRTSPDAAHCGSRGLIVEPHLAQEREHDGEREASMSPGRDHRDELTSTGPASDGLRVDLEHAGDIADRQHRGEIVHPSLSAANLVGRASTVARVKVVRIVLVAVVLAGCGVSGLRSESGHRSEERMPTCSSWDGKVVSSKEWRFGCKLTADRFPLSGSIKCADGRLLWHNAWGWGYEGEVAHTRDDGQPVPPDSETKACNSS